MNLVYSILSFFWICFCFAALLVVLLLMLLLLLFVLLVCFVLFVGGLQPCNGVVRQSVPLFVCRLQDRKIGNQKKY